jgi:hypothetical protein
MGKTKYSTYYLAGSVSLITFAVYLSSLKNDFVNWDDNIYILDNPFIRSINVNFFKRTFLGFYDSNWFPLTWISHALDYAVWGLNPLGHHLTNNLLHAINTFLVVLLITRLMEAGSGTTGAPHDSRFMLVAAAATGLLFGLHPLHVESVAWVSERKDLLCALFFLLSVKMYMRYAGNTFLSFPLVENPPEKALNTGKDPGQAGMAKPESRFLDHYYLLSLCFFALALLSKPMAISIPLVLLILDWHPFQRIQSLKTFRTVLMEKIPFIVLGLGSSLITIMAQKAGGAIGSLENASLPIRVFVAFKALAAYLWKMVLPVDLVPFYPYPRMVLILSLEYLLPVVLITGIMITSVTIAKKQKLWLSVWGYYVITLLPVLGILRVGSQAMADRYTYLPSLGPFLIIGLGIAWIWKKTEVLKRWRLTVRIISAIIAISTFVCMSYLTVRQIGVWKNSYTLWTRVIEKEPAGVPRAYKNRAIYFSGLKQFDKAIADYDKLLSIDPSHYEAYILRQIAVETLLDRGNFYLRQGNKELAIPDFQNACLSGNFRGCAALNALGKATEPRKN